MEIIAGDIGATKSALVWATGTDHASCEVLFERVYASADFANAVALLQQFISDAQAQTGYRLPPANLTLALPGVVHAQRAQLTNLDWMLDAADLQMQLNIATVQFINDFQAAARGVATLSENDTVHLNAAEPVAGRVRAITGAGTGLGLAWMAADAQGRYRTFATEGGHIDFAPANAQQGRLLAFVRENLIRQNLSGHVSWERLVSGLGLDMIYRFCVHDAGGVTPEGTTDGARLDALAASGDPIAQGTLDLFIDLYGAWVGNTALLYRPEGGLYLAGGVSIHLRERITSPRFIAACTDKGRMRGVVERTPISLITNRRLGVQGALAHAFETSTIHRNRH